MERSFCFEYNTTSDLLVCLGGNTGIAIPNAGRTMVFTAGGKTTGLFYDYIQREVDFDSGGTELFSISYQTLGRMYSNPLAVTIGGACTIGQFAHNVTGNPCFCEASVWRCIR